ncbi:CASP8 and FADD-like apoptosis regulator [Electrophorus electricus]|uniref:CASP8 and FADD-like apoptosis regulator n=1 Tax=Electrophorus electricus TaxID=8005 RepID=A0A4W4ES87_ELEEL|nr:CASP8 and FADD-like apoptosis regulator [Electrophorus electricus]XP_026877501.2 CASP8 and FADD-like apoptosis regulator [Electrophorus electricus]
MSPSEQHTHIISQIVEQLSAEERKRVSYLCGARELDRCAADARAMLQRAMSQAAADYAFLLELVLRIRRYDLLKRVLGTSKAEVERLLNNRHALPEYRVLMAELSEDVGSEDLESLMFLLRGTLPKEKLEKFECFLDVVVELEKLDHISITRIDVMEEYLRAIHRMDLAKKLSQYQSRVKTQTPGKPVKSKDDSPPSKAASPNTSVRIPLNFCNVTPIVSKHCAQTASTSVTQNTSTIKYHEIQEHVYRIQRNSRGVCVIIDCVGTEGVHLKHVFEGLHFHVSLHCLLSAGDMLSTLREVSMQRRHRDADAFVCCIVSRTCSSSSLLGTDSYGLGLNLDILRRLFAPDSCPSLAGKPKLFFIQGYDGTCAGDWEHSSGELQTDSSHPGACRAEDVAADADVFWSHCWTREQELGKDCHRSVYLHSLSDALQDGQRRGIHLVNLHLEVNRAVYDHNRGHPSSSYHLNLRHTLRKNVYLS